jgi:hypothetical protein
MQASKGAIFGASKGAMLGTSKGANNAINKGDTTDIFDVSEGAIDPLPCSLHSFTTSFAGVELDQLKPQTHFDADSIFLFVITRLPDTYAMTFKKSSHALFNRQTRVSQP